MGNRIGEIMYDTEMRKIQNKDRHILDFTVNHDKRMH